MKFTLLLSIWLGLALTLLARDFPNKGKEDMYLMYMKFASDSKIEGTRLRDRAKHEPEDLAALDKEGAELCFKDAELAEKAAMAVRKANFRDKKEADLAHEEILEKKKALAKRIEELKRSKVAKKEPPKVDPVNSKIAATPEPLREGEVEMGEYGEYARTPEEVDRWLKEEDIKPKPVSDR